MYLIKKKINIYMMEIIIDNRENSLIKLLEENKIVFIKKFRNC